MEINDDSPLQKPVYQIRDGRRCGRITVRRYVAYPNAYPNQRQIWGVLGCQWVFPKRLDLRKLVTRCHPLTPFAYLGVKWSQVQILSARHCQPDTCQPDTGQKPFSD